MTESRAWMGYRRRAACDVSASRRDSSLCSHLSYFQGDYTSVDVGESWQKMREKGEEKVARRREERGGSTFFAGYFMCPLCIRYV